MTDIDAVNLALLLLRVVTGLTLAAHGYNKFFGGGRIPGTAGWFDSIGMRPGKVHAVLAASTEMGAGILLALGFLTPFAGGAMVALMIVAGWTVHRGNGFFIVKSGWEYNLILALIGVVVAILGAGQWSVDHALDIAGDLDGFTGLGIALVLGVGGGIGQLALFFRPPPPKD